MASRPNRLCYLLEPLPSLASSKMRRCGVKVWESISGAPVCGRPTCRKGKIDVHGVRTLHAKRNRGMATSHDPQRRETVRRPAERLSPFSSSSTR
jgi:hypothetical protein